MSSNEEHFTYAMQLVTSTSLTMVLVNTIKLGVLEAIANTGSDARLSAHDIVSALSISNPDGPDMLDRMLRLLASHSIVTCTQRDCESGPIRVYGLAPVAKYFIRNEDGMSLGALMELLQDKVFIDSWFKLKDSVVEGGVPFDKVHGTNAFEYPALDTRFNDVFNNAMVNHTTLVIKEIIRCYRGFDNIKHLVDVGGGLGVTLNMIISKYPTINGTNFDLPHVIQHAPLYTGIKHVGGDMFHDVPQGDAIFMKWILHDWSDDHCKKLLRNCYKALPDDGKVIVVEAILPFLPDTSTYVKATTHIDAIMMTQDPGGKERTEDEFLTLAKGAGFTGIKKECHVCNLWVMEFYK
uniref:Caffeic acid 3-O-methyltransferase isoform 1 n=1 Tax=Cirsium japonicum TaxID=516546 RepID=A0A881ZKT0_9ASTR|nr:caffeic acid 3-O-methyltransferase isoform 1 [Cirsium japonicum]